MRLVTCILEEMGLVVLFDKYTVGEEWQYNSFVIISIFAAGFFGIYILQYLILRFLGFIFTNKTKIKLLIRGLSSTTIMLGIGLIFPVLIAIYYSLSLKTFLMIVIILYFITRILFIYKGIRIFFSGFNSLIYIILYLCTNELMAFLGKLAEENQRPILSDYFALVFV